MKHIDITFIDREEVKLLTPVIGELLDIVEAGLRAHANGDVVLPPKSHIHLDDRYNGHFNVLMGYVGPLQTAGVKVIGDYVDNYDNDLPSEVALLTLYDPRTGVPLCIMDATTLTWLRTGAVTGIGARWLARPDASVLAHIGARGTAFTNIRAIAHERPIREVRINSKRQETREALAHRVEHELGLHALPTDSIEETLADADIVVEATRLETPQVLVRDDMIKPGALLVTYGWVMAADPALPVTADKFIVDDWEQCCKGGTFHPLIEAGQLSRQQLHAEIGEIVCGSKPGRERDGERIVFWHRGFAVSDIVLGRAIYDRAQAERVGRSLRLW